ncbi:hypothetical protein N7532_000968 [Penicillium argentinense]|uniref:Uncharacterized protein n=1 Tax=Penicillium argentinense TaxID=1131581 RepID=A0A9W9G1V0_9EURO|nr:uncharacterized protein N7532_000968 [Penicillium argentinense]KAJ5110433.1 hypothetical protein N7532_000968 [Penicillium argentinense]
MPNTTLLTATGYGSFLLAVGHALSGQDFLKLAQFKALPGIAFTCSTVGWYQGSAYLVLTGLLNLHWASKPGDLDESLNRAMAAVIVAIAWGSSAWYFRGGMKENGFITAAAGIIQGLAALH